MAEETTAILFVNQDGEFVQCVRTAFALSKAGWRLEFAATLAEAHAIVRMRAPDLVVADLSLPDGTGMELLADEETPLVLLTTEREGDAAVEALKAGVWDVRERTFALAQRLPYLATRWLGEWRHFQERRALSASLRQMNQELERRVQQRTAQLEDANRRLQDEIAQRRAAEERLGKHQRLWERAERATRLGSWYSDLRGDGLFWSPEVYRIFGIKEDAFDNRLESFLSRIHPEDRARVQRASNDAIEGLQPYQLEHRVVLPDGTIRRVMEQAEVVRDEQGQPLEMIGVCWDVTQRYQAEIMLKNFFELSLDLFCVADMNGYFKQVNPAFESLLGYTPHEMTTRPFFDFVHPDDLEQTQRQMERIIQGGPVLDFTNRYRHKDGTYRWVSWRATPSLDGFTYAVARDITGQREAEDALRESESRFRQLADNIRDVFWIVELPANEVIYVSPAFEEIWGLPSSALYANPLVWIEKIHPLDRPEVEATYIRSRQNSHFDSQYRLLGADGSVRWIHDRGFRIHDDQGRPHRMVGIAQDITEHKRVEEGRFIRKIAEAMPHLLYVYDLRNQRLDFINRPSSLDLGYSPEESRRLELFPFEMFHPDDQRRVPELQARWLHAQDGEVLKSEFRLRDAAGAYRWFQANEAVFSRASDGGVQQILGVSQDITAAKHADEQIRQALHEKEVLLREVHHRVKNNLQIVSSLVNLQASHIKDPAALQLFDETRHRVRTMALLHETLYQTENLAKVDFPQYVNNLARYLVRSYGVDTQRVTLEIDVAEVNFSLDHAIPCGLIVSELITNALKYAFPGGRAGKVLVRLAPLDEDHFRLTVKDDGVGVPAHVDPARSTSLGLQLVHDLVQQLRGAISLEQGEGFAVSIVFFV